MTQTRLPLFTTGIPQIVPTASTLDVLDLEGNRQNDQTRLVTLWVNYSSLTATLGDTVDVTLFVVVDSVATVITTATVDQAGQPLKILDNYPLRGEVRLAVTASDCALDTGDFAVVWGYYTIEGGAPRVNFDQRALQPDPTVVPVSEGIIEYEVSVGDVITHVVHTVSDTQIDEVRYEAEPVPLVPPDYGIFVSMHLLYFNDFPTAPFVLGDGYISCVSPVADPGVYAQGVSLWARYLDGVPFRGAGVLKVSGYSLTHSGSFVRN